MRARWNDRAVAPHVHHRWSGPLPARPCDGPSHWAMSDDYDGPAQDGLIAGKIKVL